MQEEPKKARYNSKYQGVNLEFEKQIRDELKIKPMSLFKLAKKIGCNCGVLDCATAKMCDVYEDDKHKIRLIGAGYERD